LLLLLLLLPLLLLLLLLRLLLLPSMPHLELAHQRLIAPLEIKVEGLNELAEYSAGEGDN